MKSEIGLQGLFGWIWLTCLVLLIFSMTRRGVAYVARHGWNLWLARWLLAAGFVLALSIAFWLGLGPPNSN